ncbi:Uncharacterised protein [Vibrio cholerae]|nr:Uncharacterised protein [Vibrio cholerae]CSC52306.1 Uncharacterised protein [Vibrio cholerae]
MTFCLDIMLTSWRFNEMAQAKPIFKTRRNHVYTDVCIFEYSSCPASVGRESAHFFCRARCNHSPATNTRFQRNPTRSS